MKIKCTFHIAIAFILIQLTDEFSIAFAYGICEKNPYVRILYVTFAILSLLTMIYLYTKYIIRIQMQDLFLGMPLPKKKWCITAVLMPVLICLFYIFFTKGTFEKGNLTCQLQKRGNSVASKCGNQRNVQLLFHCRKCNSHQKLCIYLRI